VNDGTIAFGRKALQTGSTLAFLNLECLEDRSKRFNTVDALIGELLVRCLQGERVAELIQYKDREHSVIIHGLGTEHRTFVEDTSVWIVSSRMVHGFSQQRRVSG